MTTDRTAAQTYAAHRADIARLLDVLDMELAKHQAANTSPADWGRPGDLARVRSDLIDTVAFISGMDRAIVEGFLAD